MVGYFRDLQGLRAEQVVFKFEGANGADRPTPEAALAQGLQLAPGDAELVKQWQPRPGEAAWLYRSETLAQVIPEHQGQFVVLLNFGEPEATAPPASPAPGASSPVFQVQVISGNGQNL